MTYEKALLQAQSNAKFFDVPYVLRSYVQDWRGSEPASTLPPYEFDLARDPKTAHFSVVYPDGSIYPAWRTGASR